MKDGILRLIDASANRLREALRVAEDVCRFCDNDKKSCQKLKDLRHKLESALKSLDTKALLSSRSVAEDQGSSISAQGEYEREGSKSLLTANLKRAQEAARSLEEAGKCISESFAKAMESVRYELYTLEQELELKRPFAKPCLYVLITQSLCKNNPLDVLKASLAGGASVVQLREKEMEDGAFLNWIEEALKITEQYAVPLIINDRIQLAQLLPVQGVHLGQGDLSTYHARKLLSPHQWLGRSTHAPQEARIAAKEGADYIGVGPLFATQTKVHTKAVGLEYLQMVEKELAIAYVGIGSVNRTHYPDILKLKPKGLAICTGIIAHDNPESETRFFKEALLKANAE